MSRPGERIRCLAADATSVPLPASSVDLAVVSTGVLDCLDDALAGRLAEELPWFSDPAGRGVVLPDFPDLWPCFLLRHLRSYYRQVSGERDLDRQLPDLAAWLLAPPALPWAADRWGLSDLTAFAAQRFEKVLRRPRFAAAGVSP